METRRQREGGREGVGGCVSCPSDQVTRCHREGEKGGCVCVCVCACQRTLYAETNDNWQLTGEGCGRRGVVYVCMCTVSTNFSSL